MVERELLPDEELTERAWARLKPLLLAAPPTAKGLRIQLGPLPASADGGRLIDDLCIRIISEGFEGSQWAELTFETF